MRPSSLPSLHAVGAVVALLAFPSCRRHEATPSPGVRGVPGEPAPASADASSAALSAASGEGGADIAVVDAVSRASGTARGDGGGAVVTDGAVSAEALRQKHRARLQQPAPVTVLQGGDAESLGERLCEAIVPRRDPAVPVLLKPNLGGFDWFKDPAKSGGDDGVKGRITDPEFTRGVIRCLKARGHTQITVAEGWGATHADWERLVRVSGYGAMCASEGVPLVAMDDDGTFDVDGGTPGKPLKLTGMEATHVPSLLVPKILADALDHGLYLSLPKIKAHRFAVFSLSIKAMQGTVMLSDAAPAFRQKWRMHRELNPYLEARKHGEDDRASYVKALEAFAERIVDVLEVETPDAVLAEGAPAMRGDGFQKLLPSDERFAVGGVNPVTVDRVGAELLGLWDRPELAKELGGHRTSPLLEAAASRFGIDLTKVLVTGDGAALVGRPRPVDFDAMAPFSIHLGGGGAEKEKPVLHAAHGDAVIDGRGDDAAWKRAKAVQFDTDTAGTATGIGTTVRALWSDKGLTFLFDLEGAGLHTDTSRPVEVERDKLYEEDCVEWFFAPDANVPTHYEEVEVGPYGHFFDLDVDRIKKSSDAAFSAGLTIGTSRDPDAHRATIEVRTHVDAVTRSLVPGARFPLGLFRMEGGSPRHYLAWSPPRTPKPNFHVPEAFGAIELSP